jgi:DNA-binding CsgD family transcriptional regulator
MAYAMAVAGGHGEGSSLRVSVNVGMAARDVHYYQEGEVEGVIRDDEMGVQSSIARALSVARTQDERCRMVQSLLRIVGFDAFSYLTVALDAEGGCERLYLPGDYRTAGLPRGYIEHGLYLHDPRLLKSLAGNTPLIWDLRGLTDAWRNAGADPDTRRLLDMMHEHGALSGLTFSIAIGRTRLRSVITFTAANNDAAWMTDSVFVQALTLGLSIHQCSSAYVRAVDRRESAGQFSEMQMRTLAYLAAGLTDKEIALRMRTTAHNVDYRLRRLREKCGIAKRTQLAFLAARLPGL